MTGWINNRLENARWISFAVWFLISGAFNWWAFGAAGPWARALEAGGGELPETQPGFPPLEPQRSLEALGDATGAYLMWQAIDIPYAILNVIVTSLAIALGLKATRLSATPLRFLLLLPLIYLLCEIVENTFVALFASKILAPSEPAALIQQIATTIKLGSGFGAIALGLAGLVAAIITGLFTAIQHRK